MKVAFCPECEGEFRVGPQLKVGQRITCPHCDAELEIIHLTPLELDWAYDEPAPEWEDEEEEEEGVEAGEEEEWEDQEDWEDEEEDWDEEDEEL